MINLQYQEYEYTEVSEFGASPVFSNTLELEFETLEELSEFLQDTIVKVISISQNT